MASCWNAGSTSSSTKVFPGGCFVITSSVEFASRRGRVRDALEAAVDREIAVLETAIRRANETGEARIEDASQTAFELHSILMEGHALFQLSRIRLCSNAPERRFADWLHDDRVERRA